MRLTCAYTGTLYASKKKKMELSKIHPAKKSGEEFFTLNQQKLNFKLKNFWQWNQSNLLENRTRGILAEYIVKQALEITSENRVEWDSYDLKSNTGKKIEIKSAAYIQSWEQKKFSTIRFNIARTIGNTDNPNYDGKEKRWTDFYIFCLLAHKDQSTINPLNLRQWEFYILDTNKIEDNISNQKTIGIKSLLKLNPRKCNFDQIKKIIDE